MKRIFILLLAVFLLCEKLVAQISVFDFDSSFAMQDVPICFGVNEFKEKIAHVKEEENREPLGLVLCGGSARAFAHIGVLKCLEENDIKPDFIIANSMGAIIGMLYAYGFSPDAILDVVLNLELTSYFEPVIPVQGGVLSVRKFRALINELLGKEHTDVSECVIPILVLTEDLETKRQLFMASGDFAEVMTAAFAMPAIMEFTKFHSDDGKVYDLFDSGAIDLGGIEVAERFSNNLVVSTALYDKKVNYSNPVVFLSRMSSVAKERALVEDLKAFNPPVIRNDVEHYSFMAFDKSELLMNEGYKSTQKVMEELLKLSHGNADISKRREETNQLKNNILDFIKRDRPLEFKEFYAGLKIWPQIAVMELPEAALYDKNGISAFGFIDSKYAFARLGANFPFGYDAFSFDAFVTVNPLPCIESRFFASYDFKYKGFEPSKFYGFALLKYKMQFLPEFFKSYFINGEVITEKNMALEEYVFSTGINTGVSNYDTFRFEFTPKLFYSGNDISAGSLGAGAIASAMYNFKYIGFADDFSFRYAFLSFDDLLPATKIYGNDFYRGKALEVYSGCLLTNSFEAYYILPDFDISFAELVILKKLKAGAFLDLYSGLDLINDFITGLFVRTNLSLVGLCDFIFDFSAGYNVVPQEFNFFFSMKSRI